MAAARKLRILLWTMLRDEIDCTEFCRRFARGSGVAVPPARECLPRDSGRTDRPSE